MRPMLPIEKYFGKLELVHTFYGAMPTGVSVSETGRIFIFRNGETMLNIRLQKLLRVNCSLILTYKPIWLTPGISE